MNALADDFKRRNICSLVSHWTNISCNRRYGSDSQSIEINEKGLKKTPKQKDFGSGSVHFPINSPGLQSERPQPLPPQHRVTQLGGTNGAAPARALCQGHPVKDAANHGDLLRLHEWPITLSIQKAWSKREKESGATKAPPHCAVVVTARQFSAGSWNISHALSYAQLLPSPLAWYPLQKFICYRAKQAASVICMLCSRHLFQTI